MSDNRTWEATYDRNPYENLRALMRHIDRSISNAQILQIAFARIPGLGPSAEPIVEAIREEFAEEHAVARAERWLDTQNEPTTIVLDGESRSIPPDTDGEVHPAEVRTVVAHRLGARAARTCENPDGVIECTGPDSPGYHCPECATQRRRDGAILDELLLVKNREQLGEVALSSGTPDEGKPTQHAGHESKATSATAVTDGGLTDDADHNRNETNERNGQFELGVFANGGDGGTGQ